MLLHTSSHSVLYIEKDKNFTDLCNKTEKTLRKRCTSHWKRFTRKFAAREEKSGKKNFFFLRSRTAEKFQSLCVRCAGGATTQHACFATHMLRCEGAVLGQRRGKQQSQHEYVMGGLPDREISNGCRVQLACYVIQRCEK